jgi:hypothetical protein
MEPRYGSVAVAKPTETAFYHAMEMTMLRLDPSLEGTDAERNLVEKASQDQHLIWFKYCSDAGVLDQAAAQADCSIMSLRRLARKQNPKLLHLLS